MENVALAYEQIASTNFREMSMSEKVTGGGAFPHVGSGAWNADKQSFEVPATGGMTLRDYFAAKALQGLLAEPTEPGGTWFAHSITSDFTSNKETLKGERVATAAYRLADAMLKARGQ